MSKSKRTIPYYAAYKVSRAIPKILDAGHAIRETYEPLPELRESLARSLELSADAVREFAKSIKERPSFGDEDE